VIDLNSSMNLENYISLLFVGVGLGLGSMETLSFLLIQKYFIRFAQIILPTVH